MCNISCQVGRLDTSGYGKAVAWYSKAAKQGLAEAQINLSVMYEKVLGVEQDFGKAVEWFSKAAKQGDADAQKILTDLDYSW